MGLIDIKPLWSWVFEHIDHNPVLPGSGRYNFIYFLINPFMVMSITTWDNSRIVVGIYRFFPQKKHPLGNVQRQGRLVGCWRLDTGSLARLKQLPVAMYTWHECFFVGGREFHFLAFFSGWQIHNNRGRNMSLKCPLMCYSAITRIWTFSSSWRVGEQQHNTYTRWLTPTWG